MGGGMSMFAAIIRVWAFVLLTLVGLQLIPLILALGYGDISTSQSFMAAMGMEIFLAIAILLAVARRHANPMPGEGIFFTALIFTTFPVFLGLPFVIEKQIGFAEGYTEGMSAITTSGGTLLQFERLNIPLKLWRAICDWFGGTLFLLVALVVLGPIKMGGLYSPRLTGAIGTGSINAQMGTMAGLEAQASLGNRFYQAAKYFVPIWLFLTAAGIFLLAFSGASPLEALIIGLSSIVTAGTFGVYLHPDISLLSEFTISMMMLIGALSFPLIWAVINGSRLTQIYRWELYDFLRVLGIACLVVAISHYVLLDASIEVVAYVLMNAINIISTTGFVSEELNTIPVILALTFATIGGCSLSTASGLKIFRVGILVRSAHAQVKLTMNPNSVEKVYYGGQVVDDDRLNAIRVYFVMLVIITFLGAFMLALSGLNAEQAMIMSFGAINGMLSVGLPPELVDQVNGSDAIMATLSVMMLLGRIDILMFIMLFSSTYWRR